jgi:hypothetical protein
MSTADLSNPNQVGYSSLLCEQMGEDVSWVLSDALSDPTMSWTYNPDVLGYMVRLSSRSSRL